MLELLVAADLVREKTTESLAIEAAKGKQPTKRRQRRRSPLRTSSAAALRGLADRIEPSRADAVAG